MVREQIHEQSPDVEQIPFHELSPQEAQTYILGIIVKQLEATEVDRTVLQDLAFEICEGDPTVGFAYLREVRRQLVNNETDATAHLMTPEERKVLDILFKAIRSHMAHRARELLLQTAGRTRIPKGGSARATAVATLDRVRVDRFVAGRTDKQPKTVFDHLQDTRVEMRNQAEITRLLAELDTNVQQALADIESPEAGLSPGGLSDQTDPFNTNVGAYHCLVRAAETIAQLRILEAPESRISSAIWRPISRLKPWARSKLGLPQDQSVVLQWLTRITEDTYPD